MTTDIDPRFRYPDNLGPNEKFVCYLDDWDVSTMGESQTLIITKNDLWLEVYDVLLSELGYPAISPEQVDRLRAIYTLYTNETL